MSAKLDKGRLWSVPLLLPLLEGGTMFNVFQIKTLVWQIILVLLIAVKARLACTPSANTQPPHAPK